MSFQCKTYVIHKVPDVLYKQLYSLNFRQDSLMREGLVASRTPESKNKAVICTEKGTLKVVGWVQILYKDDSTELHFYVRKKYRRLGIGSRLATTAARHVEGTIYLYDFMCPQFFRNVKCFV